MAVQQIAAAGAARRASHGGCLQASFEDGEYSATDLDSPPLLTINAPIGLNLRNEPEQIINRSVVQNNAEETIGLEVSPRNNLTLVGGEINLEGGHLTATGGRIELGGLSQAGTVTFNGDGSLSFPTDVARADVTLSNAAEVDARGTGGGDIAINARNLQLEAGEFGFSVIGTGISTDSTDPGAQAGDITINATDNVTIDRSIIANQVSLGAVGDGGDVTITTDALSLSNGGQVDASTFGQGNAGFIEIAANDNITIDGESSQGNPSGVFSQVNLGAEGKGGNVTITADTLSLTNGGAFSASTFGRGNAGSIEIAANDSITINGKTSQASSDGVTTDTLSLTSGGLVNASTLNQGNVGSVTITATDTIATDGKNSQGSFSGAFSRVNLGAEGKGGNVTITTDTLSLTNGGRVSASTRGQGDAGSVEIAASDTITIDNENPRDNPSGVFSRVEEKAVGNGGGVTIKTDSMFLTNSGAVSTTIFGRGKAGSVKITATDSIAIDGDLSGIGSQIADSKAEGAGGNVNITTDTLSVTNGGLVTASTFGQGDAGSVEITATDNITIDGETSKGIPSRVISQVGSEAVGDEGDVTIATDTLSVTNGGQVNASTEGQGNAGVVTIEAGSISLDGDNARINSSTNSGNGGIVNLDVDSTITLNNDSFISAQAFEEADGGNLSIDAQFIVAFPNGNNDIIASAEQGRGGNITINAESILGIQERPLSATTNDINASSSVSGFDGTVDISTLDVDPVQGATELPINIVVPEETTQQACQSNREAEAKNGLNIVGKGGVPPAPELPLNSLNTVSNGEMNPVSTIPAPIETSRGKIQPARGIEVTPSGVVRLTAYATNNAGDRLPQIESNCGQFQ